MRNEEIAENLSLVIYVKEITQRLVSEIEAASKKEKNYRVINWGQMSTEWSLLGLVDGLEAGDTALEALAEWVHAYWVACLENMWELLAEDDGFYTFEGGYSDEKRASHNLMRVSYDQLSREDQLKDLYVIKTLLTEDEWLQMGGDIYEVDFERYDIGW